MKLRLPNGIEAEGTPAEIREWSDGLLLQDTKRTVYPCPHCDIGAFDTAENLLDHVRVAHPPPPPAPTPAPEEPHKKRPYHRKKKPAPKNRAPLPRAVVKRIQAVNHKKKSSRSARTESGERSTASAESHGGKQVGEAPPPADTRAEARPLERRRGGRQATHLTMTHMLEAVQTYVDGGNVKEYAANRQLPNYTLLSTIVSEVVRELGGERHQGMTPDQRAVKAWLALNPVEREETIQRALSSRRGSGTARSGATSTA